MLLMSAMLLSTNAYGTTSSEDSQTIERISFSGAPPNPFPYSPAVSVDLDKTQKLIFVSGQITKDPVTGESHEEDIQSATNQVLDNVETLLKAAGSDWKYVVRVDVFLKDMSDFASMNEEYSKRFPDGAFPARQTIQTDISFKVEISVIAIVPK